MSKPLSQPAAAKKPQAAAKSIAKPTAKPTTKPTAKPVAKAIPRKTAKTNKMGKADKPGKAGKTAKAALATAPEAADTAKKSPKGMAKPATKVAPAPSPKPDSAAKAPVTKAPKPGLMPANKGKTLSTSSKEKSKASAASSARSAQTSPPSIQLSGAASSANASTSHAASANRFTDRFAPAPSAAVATHADGTHAPKAATKADAKTANAWKSKAGRELSEAELLAMPETEYMNDKQLDFFRVRLQKQRDDLLSNAGETTEHLREDTSIVPDPVDRATIEEEHALELRTRDRERKLLKKISQSISRLETGEYGFCDETGEPIGLLRLMARPTATLSLEAQQRRELKQKMFGD